MPSKTGSPFSIDRWQDTEPVNIAWFDNSLLAPLSMAAISVFLVFCSALVLPFLPGSKPGDSGIAKKPIPGKHQNLTPMGQKYLEQHKNSPTAVPDLITEMLEKEEISSDFFREQLNLQGCSDGELLRKLSARLQKTRDSNQFARIITVLNSMPYDSRDLPEMKSHVPAGMAAAGRHVNVAQLRTMPQAVQEFVFKYAQLPQGAGLFEKLAAMDHQWNSRVLFKFCDFESEDAAQLALKIVKQNNTNTELLLHFRNSEAVCNYLWNGKLTGQNGFEDLSIGTGEASLKAFSQVVASMIDENPESLIGPVMSMYEDSSSFITRVSLPEASIQKIDTTISAQVEKYLSDIVESESVEAARIREMRSEPGPFAFLYLAELLGGRKTALEIMRMVDENPAIPKKFKPIGDALLSINEPESYDTLVEIWTLHSYTDNKHIKALGENVGQAIESNFLDKLAIELAKEKKNTRRMAAMVRAIEIIGTEKSIPTLRKMENIRSGRLNSKARDAIYEIQKREKANN